MAPLEMFARFPPGWDQWRFEAVSAGVRATTVAR